MTEPTMSLTVLGCATPYPQPGQPCSGYLVRTRAATVWLDAGSGTFAELLRHVAPEQVDLIWVSHLHPDHSTDLLAAWNLYVNDDTVRRPAVAGPLGWTDSADAFLGRPGAMREVFEVFEHGDHSTLTVGDLTLVARRMKHGVPTYGVRTTAEDGTVLAYSADTAPCTALTELAAGADLLVIEAGADTDHPGHCTPEDAAKAAAASDARAVLLTHLVPGLSPADAVARAAKLAPMPVDAAHPGLIRPIGQD